MNRTTCPISRLSAPWLMIGFALLLLCGQPVWAQAVPPNDAQSLQPVNVAPVIVDGNQLFTVRGITSYPAPERAAMIRNHIIAAA